MIKFFKRFVIFITVSFISLNLVVFFVLNSPTIQHAIIEYINTNYLNKQKLELGLQSLSLNFLNGTLSLNNISIKEMVQKNNSGKNFSLNINKLIISFDIIASYLKQTPVIHNIIIRDGELKSHYDNSGKIIFPELFNSEKEENSIKSVNLPELFKSYINIIPFEVEMVNFLVNLATDHDSNYQKINISRLKIRKEKKIQKIITNLEIINSNLSIPSMDQKVLISHLIINSDFNIDGSYFIKNLDIKSNLLNLKTNIRGIIGSNINQTTYISNIDNFEVNSQDFFKLLKMDSAGKIIFSGSLVSGKYITEFPVFNGKISWNNLKIDKFDIYSGKADIFFKNRTIYYSNATIQTYKNAIIQANGKFQLFDKFYFENNAEVNKILFSELLNGLGVSFTPVDFMINSDKLKVTGFIMSPNKERNFEIFAQGLAKARKLVVTTFPDQKNRDPIPDIDMNLDLTATSLGVSLTNSNALIVKNDKINMGYLTIKNGYIDFSSADGLALNVKLVGNELDLSSLNYFLKSPTSGQGNLSGEIFLKPGSKDVIFNADIHAKNGEIFGLRFYDFIGKIGINPKNIWAKNSMIVLSNKDNKESFKLNLKDLNLEFNDLKTKISLYSDGGEINILLNSISHWVDPFFLDAFGKINKLNLDLNGLLFDPSSWTLKVDSKIEKLSILNGDIENVNIKLSCTVGSCSNSILSFNNIKSKSDNISNSFVIFELIKISIDDAVFRAKIDRFPLNFLSKNSKNTLNGFLNSSIQLSGKWKNLVGFINIDGINVKYNNFNIGNFSLNVSPNSQKQLEFILKLFNNQMNISFLIPQYLEGVSYLNVDLIKFNVTNFLSDEIRYKYGIFSDISAKLRLIGKSPFTSNLKNKWFLLWKGSGIIESGSIQLGRVIFDFSKNNQLTFEDGELNIQPLYLVSQIGKIEFGKSMINLLTNSISTNILLDMNFINIDKIIDYFGPSDGKILGKISLDGLWNDPKLSGYLNLNANTLSLKNYQPAFSNLVANIILQGNKVELQEFNSEKGQGTVSGAGSIDFSNVFQKNSEPPEMNFIFSARNADLRLQVPIFQFADTNLDSDISFSGNGKPYLISGNVNLKKFKMFKNIGCDEIANQILSQNYDNNQQNDIQDPFANLNINFKAQSSVTIQSQCLRGKFSTSPSLNISGNTITPILIGNISTESANLFLLKSRFEVKKAEFSFNEFKKYDPNVDIQMQSRVSSYTILANMNGKFSRARLDLSLQPSNLPNGDRATQADIISIISTGQIPAQSSSGNLLSASPSVFSFLGIGGGVADFGFLNNTVSTVTGGLVDNVNIVPTSQNGQLSWRATASRSLSERFNLGVSYQGQSGDVGASQAGYAVFLLNDTVSLFSSYTVTTPTATQIQTTNEFTGGLRFRFGGE